MKILHRLMLREPESLYVGKRSGTLLKVKTFFNAEAKVVGYEPGKVSFFFTQCSIYLKPSEREKEREKRRERKKKPLLTENFQCDNYRESIKDKRDPFFVKWNLGKRSAVEVG